MEENVLIKSTQYNIKKPLRTIVIIICALLFVFLSVRDYTALYKIGDSYRDFAELRYKHHQELFDGGEDRIEEKYDTCDSYFRCRPCRLVIDNDYSPSAWDYIIEEYVHECSVDISEIVSAIKDIFSEDHERSHLNALFIRNALFSFIPAIIGGLLYLWLRNYTLTVTDERVFGRIAFGKKVDIPVDSVSAIASLSLLKGVSVSTSSGKVKFLIMKNSDEIYNTLNNLLIDRQQKKNETSSAIESNISTADELKKFKELLDSGVISEEEFNEKKKQLLGL